MIRLILGGILIGIMAMASSCRPAVPTLVQRPKIVVTTGMLGDMVKHIVGDSATVLAMMQPGVDPHLYKASLGDLKHIVDADYLIYNGLGLEGRLARILHKQAAVKPVLSVGDSVSGDLLHQGTVYDPHIWFDVSLWREATLAAAESLSQLRPAHREYYMQNAEAYARQLDSLDRWVRHEIQSIPAERRVLITAHDAFSYFGRAYGIEVRGLQGISTISEFGLRDVTDLVSFVEARDIPAIFVETSVSDRSLKAVMAGALDRGHSLQIGGLLYADAMGAPDTDAGTYIGMVTHNVNTIVAALR